MAYGVQDFQQPNPLDFLIPQQPQVPQPQVPQPQVPQQQAPQLQAPQQQGTGQQGGGQDEEALRTAAIKAKVKEVADAGELEDGRGGFNFRKLLEVAAPFLGAGVGALLGGAKGAEAGLAGGIGFQRGRQQNRAETQAEDFKRQQLGLESLRTESKLLTDAAVRDVKRNELATIRTKPEEDEHSLYSKVLKDNPTAALSLARGSKFESVRRLAGVAENLVTIETTAKTEAAREKWQEALGRELENNNVLSEVGIRRLKSEFKKEIDEGLIDGRALSDAEVELRESDSQVTVSDVEGKKLIRDGNFIVGLLGEVHEMLLTQDETAKALGPLTELGSSVEQALGGQVDPRVAEIRAKLKLVTEIFARIQTGAAISNTEIKNFNELVGNTNLTAKELELRMSVLSESFRERMEATYRQAFDSTKTGFVTATPARQAELLQPMLPATFTRQLTDEAPKNFDEMDNDAVSKTPEFQEWLKRNPRYGTSRTQ